MPETPEASLIICTRNRPERLERLLFDLKPQTPELIEVIVVDSSTNELSEHVCRVSGISNLHYIHTGPGLPHQRNVGVTRALKRNPGFISFLDDDIQVGKDYFEKVSRAFSSAPGAIGVGGYDKLLDLRPGTWYEKLFLLRANNDYGRILKSGVAVPPKPQSAVEQVDWFAGHSMNFRSEVFESLSFNERIRMYGEDVDFQLLARARGKLVVSRECGVYHNQEAAGRDTVKDAEALNAGFRWSLTSAAPGKVTRAAVIWSCFGLMLGYGIIGAIRPEAQMIQKAKGLALFFFRLLLRRPVTQVWGP